MKTLISWLTHLYKTASVPQRLYGLAMLTFVGGQLLAHQLGNLFLDVATTLAMGLIIGGFVMWCLPTVRWLHRAWDKPFAKTPIVLLHIFVLLVATVLARSMVAEALALPPQSFDSTVGFLVLLFYLPAWMLVAALILALAGLILMLITLLQLPLEGALRYLILLIRAFGGHVTLRQTRSTVLLHGLGAFIASSLLLQSYTYLAVNYQPLLYTLVRIIALKSDFYPAPLYPGVRPGEFIHPLENGFAAFALAQADKSVIFTVRAQENVAEPQQIGEPVPSPKQLMTPLLERLRPTLHAADKTGEPPPPNE
ncbi:hypothetical protein [Pseudomonas chlororaphis]|uniref:hypothetical protein n=1 Tax=Pseudomonas chlororaphis TaxID=587753 RepID=UPI002366371F|nr:hypothetical protein [Pseudomonas chlororaphis]WDH21364.1 hypothetical protein PUP50_25730 [Pseudomonas chlororaphis]